MNILKKLVGALALIGHLVARLAVVVVVLGAVLVALSRSDR